MTRIKNYEGEEAECLDYTSPNDMEEGVYDINDDKNDKLLVKGV